MHEHSSRIAALEAQVANIKEQISDINKRLDATATREDISALRTDMRQYTSSITNNLWKLVFALIVLLGSVVVAALGSEAVPALFQGSAF